jgi:twitching motility protein PilU
MEKSEELGMQTFDSHLYKLYKQGVISLEEALKNADSPSNLQVKINLEDSSYSDMSEDATDEEADIMFDGLALESIEGEDGDDPEENKILKTPQELMDEKIAKFEREKASA